MSAAEGLIGETLKGSRGNAEWTVVEQISQNAGHTPGAFSVGYRVLNQDGKEGFLKASDLAMASQTDDPVEAMMIATSAHQFERSILEHCQGSRLDRIVTAIDFGTKSVVVDGIRDLVFFIVFELAKGDLRRFVLKERSNDLIWHISAIHNLAIALNQLHTNRVYHNDFKPANALVFEKTEKIGDLGRASSPLISGVYESYLCPGDGRYAPPEQLYSESNDSKDIDRFIRSTAGDLYNLGSIMHYFITKRMVTPQVLVKLDPVLRPMNIFSGGWCDSYQSALPYWRQAFNIVISEFYDELDAIWTQKFNFALDELKDMILHLCEPDYRLRGDRAETPVSQSKYSLNRIISRLDLVRSKIIVASNAG